MTAKELMTGGYYQHMDDIFESARRVLTERAFDLASHGK